MREYLLEKFGRKCVYCGAENIPLQVEHIVPKARGGTNRVSNLTLACETCNQKKSNQTAEEFGYPKVQAQAKKPLKDAAAVNATRWALYRRIQETGLSAGRCVGIHLPLEVGTGGMTKYNRSIRGLPGKFDTATPADKTHWLDAVCVGASTPEVLNVEGVSSLVITAMGRGSRQMCRMDKYGFPRTSAKKVKQVHGFQTGDMVKAVVPTGKKAGTHTGRVSIRASGNFNIKTKSDTIQGISHRYCHMLHQTDGYTYHTGESAFLPA